MIRLIDQSESNLPKRTANHDWFDKASAHEPFLVLSTSLGTGLPVPHLHSWRMRQPYRQSCWVKASANHILTFSLTWSPKPISTFIEISSRVSLPQIPRLSKTGIQALDRQRGLLVTAQFGFGSQRQIVQALKGTTHIPNRPQPIWTKLRQSYS